MANRFPLVIDTTDGNKLKELPADDNLDLRLNSIVRVQDVTALGTIDAANITVNGNKLVAQTFINLTDTPTDYIDAANKFVKVNAEGTAIEFRPFSDIGNIEVDSIEVASTILPETTGTVNIGSDPLYFNRVTANEFKGDLIASNESRVFNAATGKISYAALEGAPTQISSFNNDIGYLLTEDLDSSIAGLFDDGVAFATDITGSVFGDDSTMLIDGVGSQIVGVINTSQGTITTLTSTQINTSSVATQSVTGNTSNLNITGGGATYNVVIGDEAQTATKNVVIYNGIANNMSFEDGLGVAEYSASADLIFRAGNRIRFADTPVRFSQLTDTEAGYIVGQNGDVIYNTTQNRLQIYQNSAWIDLHKGTFDGNVTTAAGTSNFNDVVIAGDLTVQGTTTSIETTNTDITDNVITLNNGEVGAGITNTTSGIEIDRGSEANVTFVYDDSVDKWTVGAETLVAGTVEAALTGDVTGDISGDVTSIGTSSFATVTISGDTNATGTITSNAGFIGNITGNVIGDVTGSVFSDDSTVLVDSVNGQTFGEFYGTLRNQTWSAAYDGFLTITNGGSTGPGPIQIVASANLDLSAGAGQTINANRNIIAAEGITGDLVGDVKGSVFGDDSTPIIDATDNTLNGDLTGNVTGNVTGNIDATSLTVGANDATTISIGNTSSTTTIEGTIQFTNALIANNLTADDSISITTDGNTSGEAISIGPGGSNTFINLTATNIRFFGNITNNIAATAGITGDLKGSVVSDDSTVIIDGVSGTVYKANIEDSANWDSAFSWGDHSTAGYITSGGEFTGDVKGSVFADDSSVMVNAVDFTMSTDIMNLTPLNAEPGSPISGMLVAADGTSWDPASKSGAVSYPVFYDGAAWNALY
jgi:hypothetical protein